MPIGPGPAFPKSPDWKRSKPNPRTGSEPKPVGRRRQPISPASPSQRQAVKDHACIVCAGRPCSPAHIVDRSLGGCSDALCVVPLCTARCHRLYDEGGLSILEYLEPHYRSELAHGLEHIGLLRLLERVTNQHWKPEERSADEAA